LDGDLEPGPAGEVTRHVAECRECSRALEQLTEIRAAARGLPELAPAPEVWDRIAARTARGPRVRWVWPVAAAAAVAGLAVFVSSRAIQSGKAKAQLAERARLEAGLTASYSSYLEGVDEAIKECEAALAQNPNHPRVKLAYLEARQNRLEAMDRLASGGD